MKRRVFPICALGVLLLFRAEPMRSAPPMETPTMAELMGLDVHTVQFRPALYSAVGRLTRDYHPVEWDLKDHTAAPPAWPVSRNGVHWDQLYGSWKQAGFGIDACLMYESVTRKNWTDLAADTRVYGEGFARTFGPSGRFPVVQSAEIGNEPGKWSDADYRTVFENMARGLRAGDPKLQVATCALTVGKSGPYSKSVDCLQGLESLYDVLTVHTYAQLEGWPTWRRSYPEDPKLSHYLPDVQDVCRWRDQHAAGKPVWITEFGYDSCSRPNEATGDFKQWAGCTDEQQAQWIVRSYLLFSSLPVGRAYLYFFNDDDKPAVHSSSGLTRHFVKKPAFDAVSHLYRALGEYRFTRVVQDEVGGSRIQEYRHAREAGKFVWVAWSPTGTGHTGRVTIPKPAGRLAAVQKMPLTDQPSTAPPPHIVNGQSVEIDLTESPLYLFWEDGKLSGDLKH